jgi:hypothetical protein
MSGSDEATMAYPMESILEDISAEVANINVPTVLLAGELDQVDSIERHKTEVLAYLPNAEFKIIKGSGHLIPIDEPHELAKEIASFMGGLLLSRNNDKGRSHQQTQACLFKGIESHADTAHSRRASEIVVILEGVVPGKVREIATAHKVGDSALYHSLFELASGQQIRIVCPRQATIRSLVWSREMRSVAFLDPSAFVVPDGN